MLALLFVTAIFGATVKPLFIPHSGESWEWLFTSTDTTTLYQGKMSSRTISVDTLLIHWSIQNPLESAQNHWRVLENTWRLKNGAWSACSDTAILWQNPINDTLGWEAPFSKGCGENGTALTVLNRSDSAFELKFGYSPSELYTGTFSLLNMEMILMMHQPITNGYHDTSWFIPGRGWDRGHHEYNGGWAGGGNRAVGFGEFSILKHNDTTLLQPKYLDGRYPSTGLRKTEISSIRRHTLIGLAEWNLWRVSRPIGMQLYIINASGQHLAPSVTLRPGRYFISDGKEIIQLILLQ